MKTLRFFSPNEFDNYEAMDWGFLVRLDELRSLCGFPLIITSDYRPPEHPLEEHKNTPGWHTLGLAVDLRVTNGHQRRTLVDAALEMQFRGIGVGSTFVHVDDRDTSPVLWTYDVAA